MASFALQAVLDYRRHTEERIQREMAQIEQRLLAADRRLADSRQALDDLLAGWRAQSARGLSGGRLQTYAAFRERLQDRIQRGRAATAAIRADLVAKREELVTAVKARKMLEKLKQRQETAARAAEARRETALLDDVTIARYHWQRV